MQVHNILSLQAPSAPGVRSKGQNIFFESSHVACSLEHHATT